MRFKNAIEVYEAHEYHAKLLGGKPQSAKAPIDCVLSAAKFNNADRFAPCGCTAAVEIMMRSASLQSWERGVLKFRSAALSPACTQPAVLNAKWLFAPKHFLLWLQPDKNTNSARRSRAGQTFADCSQKLSQITGAACE
jgi:hypothetical protein